MNVKKPKGRNVDEDLRLDGEAVDGVPGAPLLSRSPTQVVIARTTPSRWKGSDAHPRAEGERDVLESALSLSPRGAEDGGFDGGRDRAAAGSSAKLARGGRQRRPPSATLAPPLTGAYGKLNTAGCPGGTRRSHKPEAMRFESAPRNIMEQEAQRIRAGL